MPTKTREYYLTTSSSRDFTWSFFKPASPQHSRSKPDPPPPNRAPDARRAKRLSVTEEQGQALMAPADVKARAQARSKPTKAKRPKPKKTGPKNAGPWSDWYVSDDRNYFWRARKAQNETWDYQLTPGYQEPAPTQDITPATSGGELGRPLSPIPESPPGCPSPSPSLPRDPTSPKSSWPTIITTSTGYPTEDLSASSSRTLVTLPREAEDSYQPGTALVPFVVTTNSSRTKTNDTKRSSNSKRPVGPVMRLLQEGRSRKNRARTEVTQSTANNTAAMTGTSGGKPQQGGNYANNGNFGTGGVTVIKNRTASSFARKLHAKVKSEKELKVDPKKRVRMWLKGVEVDLAPMPLDAQGFPIYR
ncbi:hypothetical protein C8A01DRAFT_32379 [Parachaetomium inaequale]|uniref:Uncharacterized protein n=1 Tax=Parachaetomium inaequale TaxID=2588326 RepID=A0AAN6PP63_9PEZI|nr:hypothetical protein C8A01DRAFT_32379 [Parachaetomium inaequale]